jgi:hypothetical protein
VGLEINIFPTTCTGKLTYRIMKSAQRFKRRRLVTNLWAGSQTDGVEGYDLTQIFASITIKITFKKKQHLSSYETAG